MFVWDNSNGECGYVACVVMRPQVVFGGRDFKISNEF